MKNRYSIVNSEGNSIGEYESLELAKTLVRAANIETPGHNIKISTIPPDKPLEVGDRYLDPLGFILTIKEIEEEDNTIYVEDPDKRYGDYKGKGAIFILDNFKQGMQLLIKE